MQPRRSNSRVTSSKSINGDGQDDGNPDYESIEQSRGNGVKEEVLDLSIPSFENGKQKEKMHIGEQLALEIVQSWELPSYEKMNKPNEEKREKLMWEIWAHYDQALIDQHIRDNVDLDQQNDPMVQPREPPPDFIMPLLRYQKEWLAWAFEQEESYMKGGILADEMGMGKTVQAIALVLAEREICRKKYEAGPSTGLLAVKATLIVCPVAAVSQWLSEIIRFTAEGSTKALAHHGPNRGKTTEQFLNYDFVITTYSTLETEYRKYTMPQPRTKKICQSSPKSILHSVKWNRIILDEAHFVKDKNSSTAKAIFSLESVYRWALSGTPLQNRVGELYSLVRFLQITPFSFYLCLDCNCKILDYDSSRIKCLSCGHFQYRHFSWWNKNIYEPVQGYGRNRAMTLLIHGVLKKIVLRRTKKGRAADLALPPKIVKLRRDTLDVKEADYYEALSNVTIAQFETYLRAGTIKNHYIPISDLLTGMRQAVNHPYLVEYSKKAEKRNGCQEEDPEDTDNIKGFKASSILNRLELDKFQTSTKIEALREEISFMIERDSSAKGTVFSQFNSFLDLINFSLQKSGINCVQLDGSMSIQARDAAMKRFNEDADCKIFLASYKAGGVALNLTVASHVFLMDPWWNPALERQAEDRVHRIGQRKPTRVVRFIIENSIEEKILDMQKKKELLFEGTVGGKAGALGELDLRDIKSLFFEKKIVS